jgi:hypothetical protein
MNFKLPTLGNCPLKNICDRNWGSDSTIPSGQSSEFACEQLITSLVNDRDFWNRQLRDGIKMSPEVPIQHFLNRHTHAFQGPNRCPSIPEKGLGQFFFLVGTCLAGFTRFKKTRAIPTIKNIHNQLQYVKTLV